MSQLFDDSDLVVEVPLLPEPRRRKGAAAGSSRDARFLNDYPPEWKRCTGCLGKGTRLSSRVDDGPAWTAWAERHPGHSFAGESIFHPIACAPACLRDAPTETCPYCLGMGSLKARVRLEAGHRCVRCKHPWMPKGDAKMLNALKSMLDVPEISTAANPAVQAVLAAEWWLSEPVERSGMHPCPTCRGCGGMVGDAPVNIAAGGPLCPTCKGEGKVWEHWSPCTEECVHGGPVRVDRDMNGCEPGTELFPEVVGHVAGNWVGDVLDTHVEAAWRILTVHHLDGDKANCRWWNLCALCQACHLSIQGKVVMERIYPHPHSEWFRPYAAAYYAWSYLGEDLTRDEVEGRMDELLALELDPAYG